jgi:type I restriction enzyme, S subunit
MGSGGTPLTSKREYYEGGTIPWLQSGEVAQGEILAAANFITQAGFENSATRLFPPDTVLVAMYGATAGQVGILRFEAATNQAICGILPNAKFHPKFLYYALLSKKGELISRAVGNAQPNISQIKIKSTYVPVPPFPEQRRIVTILDEAFEGIDTAVANTEKNLANARALFNQFLNSTFNSDMNRWNRKKIGEVCNFEGGSQPPKSDFLFNYKPGYVRFLQIRDFDSEKYVTFIPVSKKNRLCESDDILIGRYGASVGKILTGKGGAYNVALIKTLPDLRVLSRSWLYYFLLSAAFQGPLAKVASRSAQAGFSKEDIYSFPIPVTSLSEQELLSSRIDAMAHDCERLGVICREKLALLADLKQTILRKAFAGELTAHPDKSLQDAAG